MSVMDTKPYQIFMLWDSCPQRLRQTWPKPSFVPRAELCCFVSESTSKWASLNSSWQIQAEECQGQYPRTKVLHQGQEACILKQHELSQHEGAVTEECRVMNNFEILRTYFQCYWFLTCCQRNYNQGSTWGWKAMDD